MTNAYTVQQPIQITEIFPNPKGKDGNNEWVELTNFGDSKINLENFILDDEEGGSKPYKISQIKGAPPQIDPNESIIISKTDSHISLNNTDDSVRLFDQNNELIDSVSYAKTEEGKSFAKTRILSEQGEKSIFRWTSPSPNKPNQPLYRLEGVVASSPEIKEDFYFTFMPKNSQKTLKITFDENIMDFNTAKLTFQKGKVAQLLTSKKSNREFTLLDYKLDYKTEENQKLQNNVQNLNTSPSTTSPLDRESRSISLQSQENSSTETSSTSPIESANTTEEKSIQSIVPQKTTIELLIPLIVIIVLIITLLFLFKLKKTKIKNKIETWNQQSL